MPPQEIHMLVLANDHVGIGDCVTKEEIDRAA